MSNQSMEEKVFLRYYVELASFGDLSRKESSSRFKINPLVCSVDSMLAVHLEKHHYSVIFCNTTLVLFCKVRIVATQP